MNVEEEFDRVWHLIEASLAYEIGGQPYTKTEVFEMFLNNEVYLWTSDNSAVLCMPLYYPRRKHLLLWTIGGNLKEIIRDLKPKIEDWASEQGFSHIIGNGRKQWAGTAKKLGYLPHLTIFQKTL